MGLRDFFWTNDQSYLHELMPIVERTIDYVLRDWHPTAGPAEPVESMQCAGYGYGIYSLEKMAESLSLALSNITPVFGAA
jgi:hypothetical protein